MTIPIQQSTISAKMLMPGVSRYSKQNVILWGEMKKMTFDLYLREKYEIQGDEKVMLITKGVEYRPDLVSYDVYGFPDAWWKILEANKMTDIWDFKAGKTILLPTQVY